MNSSFNLSFIDFLSNTLVCFMALFLLSFFQISEASKGNILDKSEFIVEMEWEDGSKDDIDLWVQNPEGKIVWFSNKDIGLMTLDRDQMGNKQNIVVLPDGSQIEDPIRREVVSIRTSMPGRYVVNAILYSHNSGKEVHVKMRVRKLNPYQEIYEDTKILRFKGDQATFLIFDVDNDGNVISIDKSAVVDLLSRKVLEREP